MRFKAGRELDPNSVRKVLPIARLRNPAVAGRLSGATNRGPEMDESSSKLVIYAALAGNLLVAVTSITCIAVLLAAGRLAPPQRR